MEEEKLMCRKCGVLKEKSLFYLRYSGIPRSWCKDCIKDVNKNASKIFYHKNKRYHNERMKKYREKNPKLVRQFHRNRINSERNFAKESGIILQDDPTFKRRSWTGEEEKFLMDNLEMPKKELALKLGRSIRAIDNKKSKILKETK